MSTETGLDNERGGMTRRRMLQRSAAVGVGVVWTTPLVQSVMPSAFAVGSSETGSTYSEIAVLINIGGTIYRLKYEPQESSPGAIAPTENGKRWNLGVGKNLSTYPCDTFFRNDAVVNATLPTNTQVSATLLPTGQVSITVYGDGFVVAFAWHNGQCCYQRTSGDTATAMSSGTYGNTAGYTGVVVNTTPAAGEADTVMFFGTPPNGSSAQPCP
jgi:hypothetical protein